MKNSSVESRAIFVDFDYVMDFFKGKTVAIVCSGPSCLNNTGEFIDSHDIVVRVNNYKIKGYEKYVGTRVDVLYSFFGNTGYRRFRNDAIDDGVKLCMCKCPNSQPIESEWHRRKGKLNGIDFRHIYRIRENFWFGSTYIPTDERFVEYYNLLGGHIPTTGFACVMEISRTECKSIYLTGFDGFKSGIHNVNEKHIKKNNDDPIGHVADREVAILKGMIDTGKLQTDGAI